MLLIGWVFEYVVDWLGFLSVLLIGWVGGWFNMC